MYKEEAIPLITYDPQNRTYNLAEEAAKMIRSINNPIAIISVAGLYRTGKSYLLNRIVLNRSNGFGVGPTVNPCTKGMWVWGTPITVGKTSILIVDSEGTGALNDSDVNHDTRIFALAVLLASSFVYNSVGAIDEGALESLSFVVNLTKFIQLRSNEEPDSEEYGEFMPQFFWVLRDFSLQLLDNNGDTLTSHQYLERSLQEQPGFCDRVEEKNRIRRLLRTFFPERECFTLVRPVNNESQLQQLQYQDLKQLRPEFYEQAISLRKMLFSKVKPKQFRGKTLTGGMYINLINSYLQAMNSGCVATIESSWTYVFREECRKLQAEAFEIYEKQIKETLLSKLPTTLEDVKALNKICKSKAIAHMGNNAEIIPYVNELKQKIKGKFENLLAFNETESMALCKQYLVQQFAPIDQKLKMSEYKTYSEFEKDLKLFNIFLDEHGPKVVKRKQLFVEFIQKMTTEGATFFVQNIQQDFEGYKKFSEEQINKLQNGLNTIKLDSQKQVEQQNQQIKQLNQQNTEITQKYKTQCDELEKLKQKNTQSTQQMKTQFENDFNKLQTSFEELKQKCQTAEEALKSAEREQFILQSESKKKEALLEQKISHLQKLNDEFNKKEKQYDSSLMTSKSEFSVKLRELTASYEQTLSEVRAQNLQLNEKLQETSDQLMQLEIKYENYYQVQTHKEESQSNAIKKLMQSQQTLQEQINIEITKNKQLQDDLLSTQMQVESNEVGEQYKQQVKQLEIKLQEQKQIQLKSDAILNQQIQFLQMELEEKKNTINDLKKSHDSAMLALEQSQNTQNQQQLNKSIIDLKEQHMIEIRQAEHTSQQLRKQLQQQLDQLQGELQEAEMRGDVFLQEKNKLQEELSESYQVQDELKQKIQQQLKEMESNKHTQFREKELRMNQRIKQLEEELSQCKQQLQNTGNLDKNSIEQQVNELRNYYEMEKDVLERRIHEERQKADQKYQILFEEQEQKMRDEQQQYEEEIETLKDELRDLEINLTTQQQQYDNEIELKNKQLNSMENILNETKEQLVQLQNTFQTQVEQRINNLNVTIQSLESQLTNQQQNNQQLVKENQLMTQKLENLDVKLQQKLSEFKQLKEDQEKEKTQLQESLQDLRRKYTATCDEYLEKKINYEKAIALSAQQNEFFAKKVEELERQLESCNLKYEERIKIQKQEWTQELSDRLSKLNEEKQQIESKSTQLKKQLREKETQFLKAQQDLEKETALSTEKIVYLEQKLREHEQQTSSENSNAAMQLKQLREQFSLLKSKSSSDIEQLKSQLTNLEFEKQELQANYEKDKILWQGKTQFLESQRESLKQELADAMRKFETTIQTLQRQRSLERNDHNQDITEMLNQIERKYQDQVKDIQQQHQKKCDDYQERIERLEKELKQSQSKELLDQQSKIGQQFERKTAELLENEKRLLSTIEELKQERDQRILEHHEEVEQEKEYWRNKINELEERQRESDKKQSQLIFYHEKERAKWSQEKDYIMQQKMELQDQLSRLEKKKELLLKENEKMKNSSKSLRKYNPNQTLNNSYLNKQASDKKIPSQEVVNMSYDVTKSLEDKDPSQKENLSTSTTFGSFKKYYQMMNSKQVSPSKTKEISDI
ncbi:Guanylate nucleotide binding protein (macronuclear) [Paramecium tetraurelia strain d4-2]|uniref:Guanylate nucleotide binding protein, putative n=1 Tax=Paramecium tetraurelia TaxID=5888 RepID=Q6BFF0_PARTE|nr:Guanylate nucleotide binding protein [Paramecium tetraurelia strain d4-2]CAH03621.1 Guanylate nucleotide binding protein, putative [Paramecium tetraurelia]